MDAQIQESIRQQLQVRRGRLRDIIPAAADPAPFVRLLDEVDDALGRMAQGTYGLCVVCHDEVEERRLLVDPLLRNCLDHLTPAQQRALEQDLELAERLQRDLLPRPDLALSGWEIGYRYEPLGHVSGDYCDVTALPDGGMFFALGDVSGKGIAASIMMSHLHAMFRTLISLELPLSQMVERASRVFCESTLPTHFATLVCGKASPWGDVEICNAGHLPPVLVQGGQIKSIEGSGLPVGIFCDETFRVDKLRFGVGDMLVLFTDGIPEAEDSSGREYGTERLFQFVGRSSQLPLGSLVADCIREVRSFRNAAPVRDDLTLLAIRRVAGATA